MDFNFSVAVLPDATSMVKDLRYVKSALLYADKVTLISPLSYVFSQLTDESNRVNEQAIMRLLSKTLELAKLKDMATYNCYAPQIESYLAIMKSKRYKALPYLKKLELKLTLTEAANQLTSVIFTTIGNEQCAEMSSLIKSGSVIIEKMDAPLDDAVAYGLEFFRKMRGSIKSSYALFDESSNEIMSHFVGSNIVQLSEIEKRKVTHAGFADNVIQRLPSFEQAKADEIINIKDELNRYIVPFRKEMIDYSSQIKSLPWDKDFESECRLLYDAQVAPKIHEIEQAVRDNNVWKNLGVDILKDPKNLTAAGGLAIGVAANGFLPALFDVFSEVYPGLAKTATDAEIPILIATAVFTVPRLVSKVVESLQSHAQSMKDVEKNDCYFYYKAAQRMSKL